MDKDVVPWLQMMLKTTHFNLGRFFTKALETKFGLIPHNTNFHVLLRSSYPRQH